MQYRHRFSLLGAQWVQHGFYGGRSTTTSALEFSAFIRDSFKNMSQVDVIFTDISKAFDSINHIVLIVILGVGEPLLYNQILYNRSTTVNM